MKTIKAIKIDVTKKQVYEVEIDGSLAAYYKELECDLIEKYSLTNKQDLIIDEEGWVKNSTQFEKDCFSIDGVGQLFKGHGLIVDFTPGGSWVSTTAKLDIVRMLVTFHQFNYDDECYHPVMN
jgi:hypothetical protein